MIDKILRTSAGSLWSAGHLGLPVDRPEPAPPRRPAWLPGVQDNPVGQWIVDHDRGHYMRPLEGLYELFQQSRLEIVDSSHLYLGPIKSQAILARPPK